MQASAPPEREALPARSGAAGATRAGRGVPPWLAHPALWHITYWVFRLVTETLPVLAGGRGNFTAAWLRDLAQLYFLIAVPAYVNLWVLIPLLARRGRPGAYVFAATTVTALGAAVLLVDTTSWPPVWNASLGIRFARWFLTVLAFAIPVVAFDLAAGQLRAQRERAELERAHAMRRLELLRSQLNPHFLFNTLNSLYALAIERSPQLPELILKHATLLRYALYGAERERVPLVREVEFLAGYVELERLRMDEATEVRFDVTGVLGEQTIAPLLLIPLVENCFKHLGAAAGRPAFVRIRLEVRGREVRLELRNSRGPGRAPGDGPHGIGLSNTRERLGLLYPGRHSLAATPRPDEFAVDLQLTLSP